MHYFITGGTGFIGGEVARQLLRAGHRLTLLVRTPEKAAPLATLGAEIAVGDVTRRETVSEAMRGVDGVFHIAGWLGFGGRDRCRFWAVNVEGTRNVLEVMAELGIPKGVYTSSLAVFSDTGGRVVNENFFFDGIHLTEYDRTKYIALYEVALPLVRRGLPLVTVLPGFVYGPGDTSAAGQVLRLYLKRRLPLIPSGTAFSCAHVEDVARGHILAMEKGTPGRLYNMCGPPHTLEDLMRTSEKITGIPFPNLSLPPAVMRFLSRIASSLETLIPLPAACSSDILILAAGITYLADDSRARRELGFTTRSLEKGLRQTLTALIRENMATSLAPDSAP